MKLDFPNLQPFWFYTIKSQAKNSRSSNLHVHYLHMYTLFLKYIMRKSLYINTSLQVETPSLHTQLYIWKLTPYTCNNPEILSLPNGCGRGERCKHSWRGHLTTWQNSIVPSYVFDSHLFPIVDLHHVKFAINDVIFPFF